MGMGLRFKTLRLASGLAMSLAWVFGHGGLAKAQALPDPSFPLSSSAMPGSSSDTVTDEDIASTIAPDVGPGTDAPAAPPRVEMGLLELIEDSMFGDATRPWRPLTLGTFFSEGWWEPWVYPTAGSGGAPRQGWINSFDGVFYRLWFASFTYNNDFHKNGNQYVGDYTIFTPISRRFQFRIDVPFIDSNKGGPSNTYHGNFGDLAITPRFMLSESQDFTQVFAFRVQTPTGSTVNGNGQTLLTPQYEFWYGGLPNRWVIRGGTGVSIATASQGRTTYVYNVAVGKYWTPHDTPLIGDLVTYVATNGNSTLDNRGPSSNYFSITPGFRNHLGNNWYTLGGIEIPLTGPKSQNFAWAPTFWLMKVY